jgi:hypothetical protein
MTETITVNREDNFKLGKFQVFLNIDGIKTPQLVNTLSQKDIADGWNLVLPTKYNHSTIHHFNIYLYQLPPHLWGKLNYNVENKKICDNIYQYSIKQTKHDNNVLKLYSELLKKYPNKYVVTKLYNYLEENHISGWLMMRAAFML